jgi:hypothetical protein
MVAVMSSEVDPASSEPSEESTQDTVPSRSMRVFQYLPFSSLLGIFAGVGVDQGDETDKAVRLGVVTAQEFLAGSAALGTAFGAIVIAVLALISIWFDKTYLEVLNERRGWDYAMTPFRVTGTVGILTTFVAVVGIFTFPPAPLLFRALILGITGGLLTWSIFGTLVVISLLFEHGHERAVMMDDMKREVVLRSIVELQRRLDSGGLSSDEFQLQRGLLLEGLHKSQRDLLLDELRARADTTPSSSQPGPDRAGPEASPEAG